MSENTSTYGKTGAAGLVLAMLVWSIAVMLSEAGSNPDALTQGLGLVGVALLAIGIVALTAMLIGIYKDEEL